MREGADEMLAELRLKRGMNDLMFKLATTPAITRVGASCGATASTSCRS